MGCAAGASASVWKYAMWAWTRSLIHLFTGVNPRRVRVVFPLSIFELIECDFFVVFFLRRRLGEIISGKDYGCQWVKPGLMGWVVGSTHKSQVFCLPFFCCSQRCHFALLSSFLSSPLPFFHPDRTRHIFCRSPVFGPWSGVLCCFQKLCQCSAVTLY